MSQFITKNPAACIPAVAPLFQQYFSTLEVGTGSALIPAINAPEGSQAFDTVSVNNTGCSPLLLTVTYLTGGNCATCAVQELVETVATIVIPPKVYEYPLPSGYISNIEIQTIDDVVNQTPIDLATTQEVAIYAVGTPACPECTVIVPAPAVTIPVVPADGSNFKGEGSPVDLGVGAGFKGQIYIDTLTGQIWTWNLGSQFWEVGNADIVLSPTSTSFQLAGDFTIANYIEAYLYNGSTFVGNVAITNKSYNGTITGFTIDNIPATYDGVILFT